MNRIRKIEKWSEIINLARLDLTKPLNFITPKQIKKFSGEEARLMAKMDNLEAVPKIFKEYDVTLLPISRSEYALVKGNSHHSLEKSKKSPVNHESFIPLMSNASQSESYYLGYAFTCGIIDRLSNHDMSYHSNPTGRHTTRNFTFYLNNNKISVNKAQIEVDGQFENDKEVLLIEAKLRPSTSFNVRQLYYPFRDYVGNKRIRTFFFTVDIEKQIFKFWEYTFETPNRLDSITFVDFYSFKLIITEKVQNLTTIKPISRRITIPEPAQQTAVPQANDIDKIFQLIEKVEEGYNNSKKIAEIFDFELRQSNYYRQAGELLGVIKLRESKYHVTNTGKEYLNLSQSQKKYFICKCILQLPIFHEIFTTLISNPAMEFNKDDVVRLIKLKSNLSGTTPRRRAGTILSWCKWIENNFGYLKVENNKIISQIQVLSAIDTLYEKIRRVEDSTLEFKSSFRYDTKLQQPNPKVLEKTIAKTVSAFANAHGGTLLIGITDQGEILGLENDYETMKKKNPDGFELELRNSLDKYTRNKVANECIIIKFHKLEKKEICEIKILPSNRPIFIYDENGKNEQYVRIGNSSKPYTSDEFYDYCSRRFIQST